MFERYTEKARRVMFFARFECNQFGSTAIEPEHLLLGLLREDNKLRSRFFPSPGAIQSRVQKMIKANQGHLHKSRESVDIPLSESCKRVLAYTAEEAELLGDGHIGTEHMLLGLLREEQLPVASILLEIGLRHAEVRAALGAEAMVAEAHTHGISTGHLNESPQNERWAQELMMHCIGNRLFSEAELLAETSQVARLRATLPETEALLRLLAAKGLAAPEHLADLCVELREEAFLEEFMKRIEKQKQ